MENATVETEPTAAETEKLKTQWGDVLVSRDTYQAVVDLYKTDGIAPIVKIAAHIGQTSDVDFVRGDKENNVGDKKAGNRKLASKLHYDLSKLVVLAEQFDSTVNREVGIES